jgi:hypothetical protein
MRVGDVALSRDVENRIATIAIRVRNRAHMGVVLHVHEMPSVRHEESFGPAIVARDGDRRKSSSREVA